jgi:HSP20 family protein
MATMVRWAPFSELASLHNEMSRFMNGLLEGNGRTSQSWVPVADVWETENEVVYAFDLPGIPEDKISVELDDGTLTVSAERAREEKVEEGRYFRYERRFGTFQRTIALPQGVTEEQITAKYEHGVLELHVAKPEQPKPRRIQIGIRGSEQPKTIEGEAERL